LQLTEKGKDLYRAVENKLVCQNENTKNNEKEILQYDLTPSLDLVSRENSNISFSVAGILQVDHENTEILKDNQTHVFFMKPLEQNAYESAGILTSAKGTTSVNDKPTNVKISKTQFEQQASSIKKEQYLSPTIPPLIVHGADFEENEKATEFINQSDISSKVDDIYENTKKFQPYVYDRKGITTEDLEEMLELSNTLEQKTNSSNKNEEETTDSNILD
jgi:hypothetical protein